MDKEEGRLQLLLCCGAMDDPKDWVWVKKESGEYLPIHRQGSLLGLLEGTACG